MLAVVSVWVTILPNLAVSVAAVGAAMLVFRQRRWRDRKLLSKPIVLPDKYIKSEPKTVRDMEIGEEGYVAGSAVLTSKRTRRVFVDWTASLREQPKRPDDPFSPLKVRRLKRGFSITVRTGDQFRTGSVPWGCYAPVIEIAPSDSRTEGEKARPWSRT